MKLSQFSLLALSTILFVGCAKNAPYVKEDIDKEVMEDLEEMEENIEEMMDKEEMEDDHKEEMKDDEQEEVEEEKEEEMKKEEAPAAASGQYTAYADGVIGNGEKSVLFFHAKWCPACKKNEALLNKFYGAGEYPISVYKIDYDSASELKKQFGVVSQDTFVVIDGNGNQLSSQTFPSETKLESLISS